MHCLGSNLGLGSKKVTIMNIMGKLKELATNFPTVVVENVYLR